MRRHPHPIVVQLKADRIRRGLSLRDVHDLCALSAATVGGWEVGTRSPNLLTLEVYAHTLGRPILLGAAQELPDA